MTILFLVLSASLLSLFGGGPSWLSALLVLVYVIMLGSSEPGSVSPRDDRHTD